jgi:hypothetical protein
MHPQQEQSDPEVSKNKEIISNVKSSTDLGRKEKENIVEFIEEVVIIMDEKDWIEEIDLTQSDSIPLIDLTQDDDIITVNSANVKDPV